MVLLVDESANNSLFRGHVAPKQWRTCLAEALAKADLRVAAEGQRPSPLKKPVHPWDFGLCLRRGAWPLLGVFSLRQTGHVASSYFNTNLFRDLQC